MTAIRPLHAKLAVALLGVFGLQATWACELPVAPRSIPDGRKADLQVMLEARQAVDQYVQQASDYMRCENDGLKLMEVKAEQKRITARFNAEVRAFKAKSDESGFRKVSRD